MTARLYVAVRELEDTTRPALISRRGPRTLITWDARARRIDITACILDHARDEELALLCAGLNITFPLPDWTTADLPTCLYVPKPLRLHGDPPIQGGREAQRRLDADLLRAEMEAYQTEVRQDAFDFQRIDELVYA